MAQIIKKDTFCYGQKFGHEFHSVGGRCTRCGINQNELSGQLRKIEYFIKQPAKGIHSEMHALANEISEFCGEPKKFGMYLGIIKNIGLSRAYRIFAEMRQAKEIKTPGKLFLYLSAYKHHKTAKRQGIISNDKKNKKYEHYKRTGKNTPKKVKRG